MSSELQQHGGRILTVTADAVRHNADVVKRNKLPFSILEDADRHVIRSYGVLHEHGGPSGDDICLPSQFLIDKNGKIAWRHASKRVPAGPDPQDVIAEIRKLY